MTSAFGAARAEGGFYGQNLEHHESVRVVRGHLWTCHDLGSHSGFELGWDWEEKDILGMWGGQPS